MPTRILMHGSRGRMGQAILALARQNPDFEVAGEVDQGDSVEQPLAGADAVIDFSHATVTPQLAELCAAQGKALVIGTTGHTSEQRAAIEACAARIPIVFAPNFSIGVNTLFWLVRKAAEIVGPSFDLEVVEMHHRLKKDAPSGTARRLGEILCEARGWDYEKDVAHGREGMIGERPDREIGMHSMRGGSVVGDHTVSFSTPGERIELRHIAESRETFASGALRSAAWAVGRAPGLYDMQDVLGLRD